MTGDRQRQCCEASSNRDKAIAWMTHHLDVCDMFRRACVEAGLQARPFGINLLRERARWFWRYSKRPDEQFKFCNTHSPYIARWVLWRHPNLAAYMTCRRTADERDGLRLITDEDIGL